MINKIITGFVAIGGAAAAGVAARDGESAPILGVIAPYDGFGRASQTHTFASSADWTVPPGGKGYSAEELEAIANKEAGRSYDPDVFERANQKRIFNEKIAGRRNVQKRNR